MLTVARRNLLAEPTRLLISVGGVALAVVIILVILSLYQGFRQALGSFVSKVPADVWVVQYGSTDWFHSTSLLPAELAPRLAAVDGVGRVVPVLGRRAKVDLGGEAAGVFLFSADDSLFGPGGIAVEKGGPAPGPGEVIVDSVLSKKYGVKIGDRFPVGSRALTVAGVFRGGNATAALFVLLTPEDAASIFGKPGIVNYFLATVEAGQDLEAVAQAVRQAAPEVSAFSRQRFVENNQREVTSIFLPIVAVLLFVAFVVGTSVIGLTIYTATVEKAREYGVLKAIGADPGFLYRTIWTQSAAVAALGFGAGLAGTVGLNAAASQLVPEFVTLLRWADALWVLGATLAMGLLAAYLPMRRVAALDPAQVFRA